VMAPHTGLLPATAARAPPNDESERRPDTT
jgi:hypothetical protein